MSDDLNKRRVPFAFLDDIKEKWNRAFSDRGQTAIAFSMNDEFAPVLEEGVKNSNSGGGDQFSAVNDKLDDVKNVMVQNIDLVLERGEKLELLVDKTEALNNEAFNFKSRAKQLKDTMYWRKIKQYIIIFCALALIIFVIVWISCGIDFAKCKSSN